MIESKFLKVALLATSISIIKGCVPNIEEGVLKGFSGDCSTTLYLNLESKGITNIDPTALDDLKKVETLLLGSNSVSILPPKVFDSLYSLEYLSLDNNPIEIVGPNVFDPILTAAIYMPDASNSNYNCCSMSGLESLANIFSHNRCVSEGNEVLLTKYGDQQKLLEIDFNSEPLVACLAAISEVKDLDLTSCITDCSLDRNCAGFTWYEERGQCITLQNIDIRWGDHLATCYIKKNWNPSRYALSMNNLEASFKGFLLTGNFISSSFTFHDAYVTCVADSACGGIVYNGLKSPSYELYTGSSFFESTEILHRAWMIKDKTASAMSGVQVDDSMYNNFYEAYGQCELVSDCISISYLNGNYFTQKAFGYTYFDPPQQLKLTGSAFIKKQGVISSVHPFLGEGNHIDCETSLNALISNDCGVAEFKFYASEAGDYQFRILARSVHDDSDHNSFNSYVGSSLLGYSNPIHTTVNTDSLWSITSIGPFTVSTPGINSFFMVEREVGVELLALGSQSTKLLVYGSEAINVRKVDWAYTFILTGCTNYFADESYASLSDENDLGLTKMFDYCTLNRDGTATEDEILYCCGQDGAGCISECNQQSQLVKWPKTDPVMATFAFPESTPVATINEFISNNIGNANCIDCNVNQRIVDLFKVEYGRKLEDSKLALHFPPYTRGHSYEEGTFCHPVDLTVTLSNRYELVETPEDPCPGVPKVYYVTFQGLEIISPRSLFGPRSLAFSNAVSVNHTFGFLDSPGGYVWAAARKVEGTFLQVNLGSLKSVRGVITQGRGLILQWVTRFRVSYSVDNVVFHDVDEGRNFTGNNDYNSKVYRAFSRPITAAVIRIHPSEVKGFVSMRVGVVVLTEKKTSIRAASDERGYINVPFDLEAIDNNYPSIPLDPIVVLDFDSRPRWEFVHIALNKYNIFYNNQLLGVSADGSLITLVHRDDASGRQQWYVIPVRGSSTKYNLRIVGGTVEGKSYLSVSGSMGIFSLTSEDFKNGHEQWTIDPRALVMADVSDLVNVARGKPVSASSVSPSGLPVPTLLVDGDTHTSFISGPTGAQSVELDLENLYVIKKFRLFNQASVATFALLENFVISFLDSNRVIAQSYSYDEWDYVDYIYEKFIDGGVLARYVTIALNGGGSLHLGELELYALESSFAEVTEGVVGSCRIDDLSNAGIPSEASENDYTTVDGPHTEVSCADICSREKRCLAYELSIGQCKIWFTKPNLVEPLAGHVCMYKKTQDQEKIISPQESLISPNPSRVPSYSYSDAVDTQGWLDSPTSWSSDQYRPYYQIDLGSVSTVLGVVTQGNNAFENDLKYVTTYSVQYSDGGSFSKVHGIPKFLGNTADVDKRVINRFSPVLARYIRIFPLSYENQIAMRVGIVVGKTGLEPGENVALSKPTSAVETRRLINWQKKLQWRYGTDSAYTNADINSDRRITFNGDPNNATEYYLLPKVNATKIREHCVSWNELVVVSLLSDGYRYPDGNWYGYRVLRLDPDTETIPTFEHGQADPMSFYIRAPYNQNRSGCLYEGDEFVFARTPEISNECGWSGCRVARVVTSDMKFDNGTADPFLFNFVNYCESNNLACGVYCDRYANTLTCPVYPKVDLTVASTISDESLSYLVDGNINTFYMSNVDTSGANFIELDLLDTFDIDRIELFSNPDVSLAGFELRVLASDRSELRMFAYEDDTWNADQSVYQKDFGQTESVYGRYIRIDLQSAGDLSLGELKVFGSAPASDGNDGKISATLDRFVVTDIEQSPSWTVDLGKDYNLAGVKLHNRIPVSAQKINLIGKTASASSIHELTPLNNMIDGDIHTNFYTDSVDISNLKHIEIDLGVVHSISGFEIYNRQDCCQAQSTGAQIMILDSDRNILQTFANENPRELVFRKYPFDYVNGKFFRIELSADQEYLSLGEIVLYGLSESSAGGDFEVTTDQTMSEDSVAIESILCTIEQCQDRCNTLADCVGFLYDGATGYLKSHVPGLIADLSGLSTVMKKVRFGGDYEVYTFSDLGGYTSFGNVEFSRLEDAQAQCDVIYDCTGVTEVNRTFTLRSGSVPERSDFDLITTWFRVGSIERIEDFSIELRNHNQILTKVLNYRNLGRNIRSSYEVAFDTAIVARHITLSLPSEQPLNFVELEVFEIQTTAAVEEPTAFKLGLAGQAIGIGLNDGSVSSANNLVLGSLFTVAVSWIHDLQNNIFYVVQKGDDDDRFYCLDSNGRTIGNRVQLLPCISNDNQQWYYDELGRIATADGSNLCVDQDAGIEKKFIYLATCSTSPNQKWVKISNVEEPSFFNIGPSGNALRFALDGDLTAGTEIVLSLLNPAAVWSYDPVTQMISSNGFCLDSGDLSVNGAPLKIQHCLGNQYQKWVQDNLGRIILADGTDCIQTNGGNTDGSPLIVGDCSSLDPNQFFKLNKVSSQKINLLGKAVDCSLQYSVNPCRFLIDDDLDTFTHSDNAIFGQLFYNEIDLGRVHSLSGFEIYNRQDCCRERIKSAQIFILNENREVVQTFDYSDYEALVFRKSFMEQIDGRFFRIELDNSDHLHLSEVVLYGFLESSAYDVTNDQTVAESSVTIESLPCTPDGCQDRCNEIFDCVGFVYDGVRGYLQADVSEFIPNSLGFTTYMKPTAVIDIIPKIKTTELLNLAKGKPVIASSIDSSYRTSNLVDDDLNTWFISDASQVGITWVEVDLQETFMIQSFELHVDGDTEIIDFSIKILNDSRDVVKTFSSLSFGLARHCYDYREISAIGFVGRYLQVTGSIVYSQLRLAELKVFGSNIPFAAASCSCDIWNGPFLGARQCPVDCDPTEVNVDGYSCQLCTQPSDCESDTGLCFLESTELECSTCLTGHYLSDNGCPECTDPSNCIEQGSECLPNNVLKCNLCSIGYNLTEGLCTPCTRPSNCAADSGICFPDSSELVCTACSPGYYQVDNVCKACQNQDNCLPGQSNTAKCNGEVLTCNACEEGFDPVLGLCQECNPHPLCLTSTTSCLPDKSLFLACSVCKGGVDLLPNARCENCSFQDHCSISQTDQCVPNSNILACIECNNGFALNELFECEACVAQNVCSSSASNCIEDTFLKVCDDCKESYYLEFGRCQNCTEQENCAPSGSDLTQCVQSEKELACDDCSFGFYADDTKTCQNCSTSAIAIVGNCLTVTSCSGTDGKTNVICNECLDGFYKDGNRCTACETPSFCNITGTSCFEESSSLECLSCLDSFYLTNSSKCEICNRIPERCSTIDAKCVENTNIRFCTECEDGYFPTSEGQCAEQNCVDKNEHCKEDQSNTCVINQNFTKCLVCMEEYFLEEDTGLCLKLCNDAPKNCDIIVKDCYNGTTVRQCSFCTEDYYVTEEGGCEKQMPENCDRLTAEQLHCAELDIRDGRTKCALNKDTGGCLRCEKGYYLSEERTCKDHCDVSQGSCIKFAFNSGCLRDTTTRACDECGNGMYSDGGECKPQECQDKNQTGCLDHAVDKSCVFNQNYMKCQTPKTGVYLNLQLGTTSNCTEPSNCAVSGLNCIPASQVLECLECYFGFDIVLGLCVANSVDGSGGGLATPAIAGIVAGGIAVALIVLVVAFLFKRKAGKDLEKIENRGLGGMTPEQFVLNEVEMERMDGNTPENLLQTDAEYEAAQGGSDNTQPKQDLDGYVAPPNMGAKSGDGHFAPPDMNAGTRGSDGYFGPLEVNNVDPTDDYYVQSAEFSDAYWVPSIMDNKAEPEESFHDGGTGAATGEKDALLERDTVKSELENAKKKMAEMQKTNELLKARLERIEA